MKRPILFAALLGAYLTAIVHGRGNAANLDRLDPFAPRPRAVEIAMVERRFPDALPIALELRRSYPHDPLPNYWLALIYHGVGRATDEAGAWEQYVAQSQSPLAACPALPDAYAQAGEADRALAAYERCAAYDASDPQRLLDLAAAYRTHGRLDAAQAAYERAARLDPNNPVTRRDVTTDAAGGR